LLSDSTAAPFVAVAPLINVMLFARGYSAGLTAMRRVTTRPMLATTVQTAGARMYSTPATTPVRRILRPFYLAGTAVLVTGFALYCTDTRAGIHRYIIPPLLRYFLDGEQAHQFAVKLAKWRITPRDWEPDDPKLMVNVSIYACINL
jgi:dihydroorotate dehydrogenase